MQKLVCQIESDSLFVGKKVTVKSITRHGENGFITECILEEAVAGYPVGSIIRIDSHNLIPIDTSMVPLRHNTSRLLQNIWIFCEARNDAWNRDKKPPEDLQAYRDQYGTDWKDNRIFDVGCLSY